jgi:AraC-like DNA-binding protein
MEVNEIAQNMKHSMYLGNLKIVVNRIVHVMPDENWQTTEHFHSDFEFHIIPEGKGYVQIEGTELEVHAGEFYITGPFVKHSQVSDKGNPMREYCLECEINIVNRTTEEYPVNRTENQLLISLLSKCHPRVFKDNKGICLKFAEMIKEEQEKALGYGLRLQTLIIAILIDIFRIVASIVQIDDQLEDELSMSAVNKQRINRLLDFIHFNYKLTIGIKDAAALLFLSTRQTNRLMIKDTNCSFHEYLANFRIKTAKMLLKETNLSIENIAAESGFGSVRYMYQVFKKNGYVTPNQIREQQDVHLSE